MVADDLIMNDLIMNKDWSKCKKILCIRPDNMGDLLMSSPAIRALKETFLCHITVLTSSMAKNIAAYIPEIDEVICFDFPWVKNEAGFNAVEFNLIIEDIRSKAFDAAVIFTVYSQNPLPSVMIAFMSGIPLRLSYCRENPYSLLTNWVPEKEPYTFIKHQVQRDLDLVNVVGAVTNKIKLVIGITEKRWHILEDLLRSSGVEPSQPWLVLHAGVSEKKREFPEKQWTALARKIISVYGCQVIFTGGPSEKDLVTRLTLSTGKGAYNLASQLSLEDFILLIKKSPLVVSVNTGTIHIAAATGTPIIVLYALTNPQHAPWKATGKIFPFTVASDMQSRNEVIGYVNKLMYDSEIKNIDLEEILSAVGDLLSGHGGTDPAYVIPELINVPINMEEFL